MSSASNSEFCLYSGHTGCQFRVGPEAQTRKAEKDGRIGEGGRARPRNTGKQHGPHANRAAGAQGSEVYVLPQTHATHARVGAAGRLAHHRRCMSAGQSAASGLSGWVYGWKRERASKAGGHWLLAAVKVRVTLLQAPEGFLLLHCTLHCTEDQATPDGHLAAEPIRRISGHGHQIGDIM